MLAQVFAAASVAGVAPLAFGFVVVIVKSTMDHTLIPLLIGSPDYLGSTILVPVWLLHALLSTAWGKSGAVGASTKAALARAERSGSNLLASH